MEIKLNKQNLLDALNDISGAVYKYVLIKSSYTTTISASNDIIAMESNIDSDIKKPGDICVDYEKLLKFAKNYSGDDIKITKTKAGWMNINGKSIKLRLPGLSESDYPIVSFSDLQNKLLINHNDFKNGVNYAKQTLGYDKTRAALMGIHIKSDGNDVKFTGADSVMITRYISTSKTDQVELLLSKKVAEAISNIIDKDSVIYYSENIIQVISDKIKFRASLLEHQYPNIDPVIQKYPINEAILKKSELISIIDTLDIIVPSDDQAVKLNFNNKSLNITAKDMDTGGGDASIDCEYNGGKEFMTGINMQYLKKLIYIHAKTKDDDIKISTSDPKNPIFVSSKSEPLLITLCMPAANIKL